MNQRERVKLLDGPYTAPALGKGDRAFCLARDCDVVVTSWTDARIPWARCRPVGRPLGGSGLLVDEEFVRAIKNESAAAITYWWGMAATSVWKLRCLFGIGRDGTPGSQRLIRAAGQAGADAMAVREFTAAERKKRSRDAKRRKQRPAQTGYHGPLWTPAQEALLGTVPDEEVARRIGRSEKGVREKREELGIPNAGPTHRRWTRRELRLLGRMPDAEIARRTGRMSARVRHKRRALEIPAPEKRRWTKKELAALGKEPDDVLAERFGRTEGAVTHQRTIRGIPTAFDGRVNNGRKARSNGNQLKD